MWQSIGYDNKDIAFESNGEKLNMPADAVISLNLALKCAKQFFETYKKPTCIKWRSL